MTDLPGADTNATVNDLQDVDDSIEILVNGAEGAEGAEALSAASCLIPGALVGIVVVALVYGIYTIFSYDKTFQEESANDEKQRQDLIDQKIKERNEQKDKLEELDRKNKELNELQNERNKKRIRHYRKCIDEDEQKKKDYYFGCVTAIAELEDDRGWEIRMNAASETMFFDNEFLKKVQKLALGADVVPRLGDKLFSLEVYVYNLPADVANGAWFNFKLSDLCEGCYF
ncbi:hypothetical protein BDQ17DRAFT_368415 [Cyathus striatus]|nr:hypothetical protein BDQ17DRAFT_368415 [Cyathus striatus]